MKPTPVRLFAGPLLSFLLLAFPVVLAEASILASYDSADNTTAMTAMPPAFQAPGVTASAIGLGARFSRSVAHSVDSFSVSYGGAVTNSLATALSNNSYFEFTLSPVVDGSISLSSFDTKIFIGERSTNEYDSEGNLIGPFIYWRPELTFFSSLTGGFTAGNQFASYTVPTAPASANYDFSIDLSGIAEFQDITSTTTFRIYMHNAEPRRLFYSNASGATATRANFYEPVGIGTSASATGGYDVFVIQGTAVIPEPKTMAVLFGMGALLLTVLRRRR